MRRLHLARLVQPGQQPVDLGPQLRKPFLARRRGAAGLQQRVQGSLGVSRKVQRQRHVGRRHSVQHHRAHVVLMPPQVDQRRAGPVGAAVKVHLLIAQPGADVVQVVHRRRRGVEAHVGVPLRPALPQPLDQPRGRNRFDQGVLLELALQAVGIAGPPLVHQNHVPAPPDALDQRRQLLGHGRRTLSRPSHQEEQGVRRRIVRKRRQHDRPQPDLTARRRLAILVDGQPAAVRASRPVLGRTRLQTGQRVRSALRGAARQRRQQQQGMQQTHCPTIREPRPICWQKDAPECKLFRTAPAL